MVLVLPLLLLPTDEDYCDMVLVSPSPSSPQMRTTVTWCSCYPPPLLPTDEDYCDMVLVFPPLLPTDEDYCDVVLVLPLLLLPTDEDYCDMVLVSPSPSSPQMRTTVTWCSCYPPPPPHR